MPRRPGRPEFASKRQFRFMQANHPRIAHRMAHMTKSGRISKRVTTNYKRLPERKVKRR